MPSCRQLAALQILATDKFNDEFVNKLPLPLWKFLASREIQHQRPQSVCAMSKPPPHQPRFWQVDDSQMFRC